VVDERIKLKAMLDEVISIMGEKAANVEDAKKAIAIIAGVIKKML
jgi:hypothetical protein